MDYTSTNQYYQLVKNLTRHWNVSTEVQSTLLTFTRSVFQGEQGNMYNEPTSWIGLLIAAASFLCILAMAADLLHGLRNRKLWFPCKYFTINAAFLSVISAAMKLPMDITTSMAGDVDQVTKLGSMAFLCTMMANLLPSVATMDSKELRTNITGLGVMVITLVLNVCIQIKTGVVSYNENGRFLEAIKRKTNTSIGLKEMGVFHKHRNVIIAAVYVTLLVMLLIIHICSSIAILKSRQMIDGKFQALHHEIVSKEQQQTERLTTVEELRQHVPKYWIMAGTGSPQFITVCSVTTSAAGVMCVLSSALHMRTLYWNIDSVKAGDYNSDYKWSVLLIFMTQFFGVILGTIAPVCRCFAPLCFQVSIKNHLNKVFKVESYWTQQLYDWKQRSILLPSIRNHKPKVIKEHVKIFFLQFCIEFQKAVVVTCKIISLVPFVFTTCAFYCLKCFKDDTGDQAVVPSKRNEESCVESGNKNEDQEDPRRRYVLQFEDVTKISGTTLKMLSRSIEQLIIRGERRQPKKLLELLNKSSGNFEGDHVKSLLSKECQDCWSLAVVTLTAIAVSLPDIADKSKADMLLESVSEGLVYVAHVEQILATKDYVSIQKAAGSLLNELEVHRKWLSINMQGDIVSQKINTAIEIVQLFKKNGEDMDKKVGDNGSPDDNSIYKSNCAKSMYGITEAILDSNTIDRYNQEQLFEHILQMITGILAACLTNLPKVIVMKCHNIEIEKREASVQAAAKLLGETMQIINALQGLDLPGLSPNDDLPFIDKWGACLRHAKSHIGSSSNEGQHL